MIFSTTCFMFARFVPISCFLLLFFFATNAFLLLTDGKYRIALSLFISLRRSHSMVLSPPMPLELSFFS